MEIRTRRAVAHFPSADGAPLPERVETAVIGGGMTGILTALMLRLRGVNAVVFESGEVGTGGTAACLGMVGLGDGLPLGRLEASWGTTAAIEYAHRIRAAADAYQALALRYHLVAEVERRPSVLYTQRWEASLESEAMVTTRLGIPVSIKRRSELPFPIRLSLVYPDQGVIDPCLMLFGLARQVPLFAGVRICSTEGTTLLTDEGDEIKAHSIVYACRTPTEKITGCRLPTLLFGHAHAMTLSGMSAFRGMYTGFDHDGLRMVMHGNMLYVSSSPSVVRRDTALSERIKKYYPTSRMHAAWEPWDTVTEDGMPLIGEVAPRRYLALGYGGRGLAHAMLASEMLTALILGETHPLTAPFSPLRQMSRVAMRETVARFT